jgi:hypothetical protein
MRLGSGSHWFFFGEAHFGLSEVDGKIEFWPKTAG